MRRRSCAIHSDSQQQFILLAEKSLNKTGIFYDQKLYAEVEKIQTELNIPQNKKQNQNIFSQFDFDEVKELQRDENCLNIQIDKKQQITIKNVIVCDSVFYTKQFLLNQKCGNTEDRQLDLVMKKLVGKKGKKIIVKYWVINYSIIDTPLVQIYIQSAESKYWVSSKECRIKDSKICNKEEFSTMIEKAQQKYLDLQH